MMLLSDHQKAPTATNKWNDNVKTKVEKNTSSSSSTSSSNVAVEVIEPGLVLLREMIDDKECQRLAGLATEWGQEGDSGFYSVDSATGKKVLNTGQSRGRIYDAATRFPKSVIQHCNDSVALARRYDLEEMPEMTCTHLLLNMYTSSQGLVWHRDIYENDGT